MTLFAIIAVLIILCAVFSYINERFIKLPGTIGVVLLSILVSIIILIADKTSYNVMSAITDIAHQIDFSNVLLNIMLGFLLFASALHFDYHQLKILRAPVLVMSTVSVLISAFVFGLLLYGLTMFFHHQVPFIYCLLFGALISPTDPVAVNALLKKSRVPAALRTIIAGESMFNDALGLILFITVLGMTEQAATGISFKEISFIFLHEVGGGLIIGAIGGLICSKLIKSVYTHPTIFLISIATVLSISLIDEKINASIPLSTVVAGLIVGNRISDEKQSDSKFLKGVWQLMDEVLNTILFVMMGLQLVLMPFLKDYWLIGAFSILIILIARFISIFAPAVLVLRKTTNVGNLFILTWAGLRGGISVAMALSLPDSPYSQVILSGCYFIVMFSILVQGLSLNKVVDRIVSHREKRLRNA
ncbi:sodium:proton antiporter [Arachidicoccus ginsenosidimutans]|uniref:cation:proton antiporter n=1 Tax=Arachidicoccus sp. BS20 TaxID=1850526 RepID=UPI0007F10435|nr:sodium:proton antiporter [Arachidicoccus sp. BS20]ANI89825.1 sodium:proton antiporter [Arachidicoccus sp. BS20]